MKPWRTVDRQRAPGGAELVLQEHDGEWAIRVDHQLLMSSRRHASEDALAAAAVDALNVPRPRVLIGGLGLGYTVRAVLDATPKDARVDVAELSSAVVRWNREHLAHLAARPLEDPRVTVHEQDLAKLLRAESAYHAILIDVDNGPAALSAASNEGLYTVKGIGKCHHSLAPKGLLVVWSAGPDEAYLDRLGRGGFEAKVVSVRAHAGGRSKHVLFVAQRR
ncbi:MAG: spermidine synthase [Myxococcaceae bacterium]